MIAINTVHCGDCVEIMRDMDSETIDLTVTSPPYDSLRTYNGFLFDFNNVAKELYRITKNGGVVVWVVNDATVKGSETLTSFKQAIYFKEIGFNVHDTMIFRKLNPMPVNDNRYQQSFEYMFVFSKGKPKTINLIMEPKTQGTIERGKHKKKITQKGKDGDYVAPTYYEGNKTLETKRKNIWEYKVGLCSQNDRIAHKHPAIFPEQLAIDHILSWSNEGDLIFDPFSGSGTTLISAKRLNRNWLGCEISEEYVELIKKRVG